METALATQQGGALGNIVITSEQVELIKNTVAKGATDDELKLYFFECKRRGVHPLDRLIHFVKRNSKDGPKVSFQTSIDMFRSQAEETGEYRGQEDPEYGPMIDLEGHQGRKVPEYAKVIVNRYHADQDKIIGTPGIAYWDEFYPGEQMGFQWRKMPRLMLAKCAEALAFRKAFAKKLAGLYTFEEMVLTDLVDQGKTKSKTASVQPGTGSEGKKEEKKTVRDTLTAELETYCGGDNVLMSGLLKEITVFAGKDGDVFMSLEQIQKPGTKEAWVGKTLGKLREYVAAHPKESTTSDCNPDECGQSTVHGSEIYCERDSKNCVRVK